MQVTGFSHIYDQTGHIYNNYAEIDETRRSPQVVEIQDKIRSGLYTEEEVATLKRQLPCIAPNAWFKDNKRKNELAHPTGLVGIDVDYDDDDIPAKVLENKEVLGLVWMARSVRHGWHVICRRQPYMSIADNFAFFERVTGVKPDYACKDLARAFYLGADEPLYVDASAFDPGEPAPAWLADASSSTTLSPAPAPAVTTATPAPAPAVATTTTAAVPVQTEYNGVSLSEIAAVLLDVQGGLPSEGERNVRYFGAACELRNVTDYSPDAIFAALSPHSTLPPAELRDLCASACKYRSKPCVSTTLQHAIDLCTTTSATAATTRDSDIHFALPPVLRPYRSAAPGYLADAAVLAALSMLGCLASGVRSIFNGRVQHLGFQTVLIAEQGGGKSFIDDMKHTLLQRVEQRDEAARARKKEWQQAIKAYKMTTGRTKEERQQLVDLVNEEPHDPIVIVPENVSISALLSLLDDAGDRVVIQTLDEITVATAGEKRGFSNISNLLKISFDGGTYAQQYISDTTWSGSVKCMLSTLWAAQPSTFDAFFGVEKWLDGTASRHLFVDIPTQRYKQAAVWKPFTPAQRAEIEAACRRLDEMTVSPAGKLLAPQRIELPWLESAVNQWSEEQRQRAKEEGNENRDIYRGRDAVLGFRAGVIAFLLWGQKDDKTTRRNVRKFALWVADRAIEGHLHHAPTQQQLQKKGTGNFIAERAYNILNDTFTREELANALKTCNLGSPEHVIINAWKKAGLVTADKKYAAQNFTKTK